MVSAFEKSSSETSGLTSMLILLLLNTVGVKFRPTPKVLYSMVMVVLRPPLVWGTGIGYSPPARKFAVLPLMVISVGSARTLVRPSSFKASMKVVQVAPPPRKRKIALTLVPTWIGFPGHPPA